MVQAELIDRTAADFAAGSTDDGAYVARTLAGEVILTPRLAAEFTGDQLPEGWTVTPWVDCGTGTLGDGMLSLDGARVGCDALLLSPRSLEISAVVAPRPDQDLGLGTDLDDVPWVMFSTKWGRGLYARTHLLTVEDRKLTGNWFEAPHRFRIDWNVLDLIFSVDGAKVAHLMVPMPGHMRALAGNRRIGTQPLRVEWIRLSPYAPAGRFTSRVLDAGTTADWRATTWEADLPAPTSLTVEVRTGDTPRPGRSWSPWRAVAGPGDEAGGRSRYFQYRALLATADPAWTPALREVRVVYSAGDEAGASSSSLVSGSPLGCQ